MSDDIPKIVDQMLEADAIIYALPVHAFGINSLMQTFLERAGVGYLRFRRPLEGKLAAVIVTGRRYSHEMAWSQVALNIMLNKMILVGSGFPAVIKNDGKNLRNLLLDEEGLLSVEESMDKLIQMHHMMHTRSFGLTEAVQ
jgi:multimeric flavodoxin WrbA